MANATAAKAQAAKNRVKDLDNPFQEYAVEIEFTTPLLATLGVPDKDWLADYARDVISGESNPIKKALADMGAVTEESIREFYEKRNVFPLDGDAQPCLKSSQLRSAIYEVMERLGTPGRTGYLAQVVKSLEMPRLIRLDNCVLDHFSRPISTGGNGRTAHSAFFLAQMARAGTTCSFTVGLLKQDNLNEQLFRKLWNNAGRIVGLGPAKMRNDGYGRFDVTSIETTD